MRNLEGESDRGLLRAFFDRRLKFEFHGSRITSDAGLLAYRELDEALGLTTLAGDVIADSRTGKNGWHGIIGLLRQSVYGRLAGYEDVNDADRLGRDPAMRWIVGFIVTNLSRPAERVVAFYNQRGTAEQWIKELPSNGSRKARTPSTRLSCRSLRNNAVRLQLHALAYNLGNFMRTLALPDTVEQWSLTTLREKLVKIGAKVVSHGRYVTFQLAEVAVPRSLFQKILSLIDDLRRRPAPA